MMFVRWALWWAVAITALQLARSFPCRRRLAATRSLALHGRLPILTPDDLSLMTSLKVRSLGSPKVLPPVNGRTDWSMWLHFRVDRPEGERTPILSSQSSGSIAHLTSHDGVSDWTINGAFPALAASREEGNWFLFDSEHVGIGSTILLQPPRDGSIRVDSPFYAMYIFGGNGHDQGARMEIGVSVSLDGLQWTRLEGPHAHGSVLEVDGDRAALDSRCLGWPSVVEMGTHYLMLYHAESASSDRPTLGAATSFDGLVSWTKRGPVLTGGTDPHSFDHAGTGKPHLLRLSSGNLCLLYDGIHQSGECSIGLATSVDGLTWTKQGQVLRRSSQERSWDSAGVSSAHLVWMPQAQRWRLYYVGTSRSGQRGIGVAESVDDLPSKFERVS